MKILALDTATEACSAALLFEDRVLSRYAEPRRGHAELILPMIDELLQEADIDLQRLDAIAVGRGPGGFTGVRIAISVAQGLAYGSRLPVVPVSTLAAVAQRAIDVADALHRQPMPGVLVCMDARMHEIYWAEFTIGEDGLAIPSSEERVSPPDAVPNRTGAPWIAAGTGWDAYPALGERLNAQGSPPLVTLGGLLPRAADIARLAVRDVVNGLAVPAHAALPVYLRNQVAHVRRPS